MRFDVFYQDAFLATTSGNCCFGSICSFFPFIADIAEGTLRLDRQTFTLVGQMGSQIWQSGQKRSKQNLREFFTGDPRQEKKNIVDYL